MTTISNLMKEEPHHWGLRGDPYLWQQLKTELKNHQLPTTKNSY